MDLSISEDGDVIKYRQPVDYFFEPAMSEGSEDDVVNIINIPFVVSFQIIWAYQNASGEHIVELSSVLSWRVPICQLKYGDGCAVFVLMCTFPCH